MPESENTPTSSVHEEFSAEHYNEFIRQIELAALWLSSATVENEHGPRTPDQASLHVDTLNSRWEPQPTGFRVFHHYALRVEGVESLLALIEVEFGLDFASALPMTDVYFPVFRQVNLPVNTWPYFREFVATVMGRMAWTPFTLPTFKPGSRPTTTHGPESQKEPERRTRARARKPATES